MRGMSRVHHTRRTVLALVLLAAASLAHAADRAPTVFVEEMTSAELAARVRAGATTILVPIGGTEQNGAHMALGKHNARARALAQRIAEALGNALVAPVIAYVPEGRVDPPTAHMRYPGTITISDSAFQQTLEGAARSFRAHGFRDVVFLGDHGGYQKDEQVVAARLNREWSAGKARVHALPEYYRAASSDFDKLLRARGYSDAEIGTHAGLADTALTLAIDPALVRTDVLAQAASVPGVQGNPARATAELGAMGVGLIVNDTVAAIRQATRR
jgi:creatinine amidohydrolase/Fe(II)-dependent formamide hydrolase-like protein